MAAPVRHWVEGMFTLLALHGETIPKYLRCKRVGEETLLAALREHGVGDLNSVENGRIGNGRIDQCCAALRTCPAGQENSEEFVPILKMK
jgi:hypothetical protein